jgi:outer membrane protein W
MGQNGPMRSQICEVLGSEIEQYRPSWPTKNCVFSPFLGEGEEDSFFFQESATSKVWDGKMPFTDKTVTILKVGFYIF